MVLRIVHGNGTRKVTVVMDVTGTSDRQTPFTIKCVGVDAGQTEFNGVKKTGGSKTHTLTTAQMPQHNHSGSSNSAGAQSGSFELWTTENCVANEGYSHGTGIHSLKTVPGTGKIAGVSANTYSNRCGINTSISAHSHTITIGDTGSGDAHNNLQPYITVYMWERTA